MGILFCFLQSNRQLNTHTNLFTFSGMVQQKYIEMNKQVTFGHVLTIVSIIVIPLLIWGVNVEVRFERLDKYREDIIYLKESQARTYEVINKNQLEIISKLQELELQLKDKENRKN